MQLSYLPTREAETSCDICLHEISINLLSPHRDIHDDSKILFQIIIEHGVFAQTIPVTSLNEKNFWRLVLDCSIPQGIQCFSIAILHESPNITWLIGTVCMTRAEILQKTDDRQLIELSLPVNKVNEERPSLFLAATFLVSSAASQALFCTAKLHDICNHAQISLNPEEQSIQSHLQQMCGSIRSGGQIDPLEISTMYERVLLARLESKIKAAVLNIIGDVCSKWGKSRKVDDLDRALIIYNDTVQEAKQSSNFQWEYWNNLGICLGWHFQCVGEVDDINRSIQVLEDAHQLTPDGNPDKPSGLINLGNSLGLRFGQLGDLSDLNRSIEVYKDVDQITPDRHPKKLFRLNKLGKSLILRFQLQGDPSDLRRAIQLFDHAVSVTPDGHYDKPFGLNNLAEALFSCFEKLGDLSDLNRSIQVNKDAFYRTPTEHPLKDKFFNNLNNLGRSLTVRFGNLGDLSDLDRSIQVFEDIVNLTPDGHPDKPIYVSNLGLSLLLCSMRLGDLSKLSRSIQVLENATKLTPDGHPNKASSLSNFGKSLQFHFECLGDLSDLDRAIQVQDEALQLTPDGHTDRPSCLSNLGSSLLSRFIQMGDFSDLNRSIQVNRDAVHLTPEGDSIKPCYLNHLGMSLRRYFEDSGNLTELNTAIQCFEDAVQLTSDGNTDKPSWKHNLGISLQSRFKRLGNLDDLNRSIQIGEDVIQLIAQGDPSMPACLLSLGSSLMTCFDELHNLSDLNRAIQVLEDGIQLTPDGHLTKSLLLTSIGGSLMRRFQKLGNLSDLNRSIHVFGKAIQLTPAGHFNMSLWLNNLGHSLEVRFKTSSDPQDLHEAILSYSSAVQCNNGPSHFKFIAARSWMRCASLYLPSPTIEPCIVAMDLIPQLAWLSTPISDRHFQVTRAGSVVRDAVATAINTQQYNIAVEWLEQGRSVIWSQLLQLRSPIDDLHKVRPDFADKLQLLSRQLEGAISMDRDMINPHTMPTPVHVDYHKIALEREALLTKIRLLPGFERFLLSKKLSQLLPAVDAGPIVLLNVSELSCDALLLVPRKSDILHVQLKDLTFRDTIAWHEALQSIIQNSYMTITDLETRLKGLRVPDNDKILDQESGLTYILEQLWHCITKPILDVLRITKQMASISDAHRIWWCPTGPLAFLPIHAAGVYPSGPKLSDYVVSSYTPTLTALLNRPSSQRKGTLLTVALAKEALLPGTAKEVQHIMKHAQGSSIVSLLESEATRQRVSEAMKDCSWVHFACHGMQNNTNPTDSCLLLAANSSLTLLDIIKLQLQNAELAFLSACETATGDMNLEEEAIHIAAGMLLAGYRGVIATMWTIDDGFAVEVADKTYSLLFKEYGADPSRAAEALHFAIKQVREEKETKHKVSLFTWIPFIHMGI